VAGDFFLLITGSAKKDKIKKLFPIIYCNLHIFCIFATKFTNNNRFLHYVQQGNIHITPTGVETTRRRRSNHSIRQ
jgi:hypothetical protein